MSILGKILILFNLLAATIFVYVAAVDWAARYQWAYAVYRQELTLSGLPLDSKREDEFRNEPLADNLTDNTLQTIFTGFGAPVRTQMEEVDRLQKRVNDELGGTDEAARRKKWSEMFAPLANNNAELDAIRRRADDKEIKWSDLERDISDLFADLKRADTDDEGKMTSQPQTVRPVLVQTLPRDKQRAVAHLLFNLHPKNDDASVDADHLRLQVVVGVSAFNEEAKHKAEVLQTLAEQTALAIIGDRGVRGDYSNGLAELRDRRDDRQPQPRSDGAEAEGRHTSRKTGKGRGQDQKDLARPARQRRHLEQQVEERSSSRRSVSSAAPRKSTRSSNVRSAPSRNQPSPVARAE